MRRLSIALPAAALAALAVAVPAQAASRPAVTTKAASRVAPTSAQLNGTVNPNGSSATYFFQYGTSTRYGANTTPAGAGSGRRSRAVATAVGGLAGSTTYHFRIVAFNNSGISYGSDRSFKTPPIPTVAQIGSSVNPIPFGSGLVVSGQLTGPPNVGGKKVALIASPFPYTTSFQVGNTELTGPNGAYTFSLATVGETTQFRVVEQESPNAASPTITEFVFPRVGLRTRGNGPGRVEFRGNVAPGLRRARVLIQREVKGGRWRTVGRARTRALGPRRSVYSHTITIRHTGLYRVVVVPPTGAYAIGVSGLVFIRR